MLYISTIVEAPPVKSERWVGMNCHWRRREALDLVLSKASLTLGIKVRIHNLIVRLWRTHWTDLAQWVISVTWVNNIQKLHYVCGLCRDLTHQHNLLPWRLHLLLHGLERLVYLAIKQVQIQHHTLPVFQFMTKFMLSLTVYYCGS